MTRVLTRDSNQLFGANDNRKVEEGYVPFVVFVVLVELTAALLLTLPNWYLST
jgi:hypothetical protein